MKRFLLLTSIWLVCSVGPLFAGDWWDEHLYMLQAFTSLLILQSVVWIIPGRPLWRAELIAVLFLQIAHNSGAYYSSVWHPQSTLNDLSINYDPIHDLLNAAEILILFGFGGADMLRDWLNGRHNTDKRNSRPRNNPRDRLREGAHV